MRHEFEVVTDHFQFFLSDSLLGPESDTSAIWDQGGSVVTSPELPGIVAVATARYGGRTRVAVHIGHERPAASEGWEELGSFALTVPSGMVVLWGPEVDDFDTVPRVPLDPGRYEGLVRARGTDEIEDEMDPDGPDEYEVVLWLRDRILP
jgi:hypothetical protein